MNLVITISAATLAPVRVPPADTEPNLRASAAIAGQITAVAPIWPVTAPSNAEAIVKEHGMPKTVGKEIDPEVLTEVDGLQLDLIPFVGDGAILTDDLPQEGPDAIIEFLAEVQDIPEHKPTAVAMQSAEPPTESDRALLETAERTYLADRPVTGVPVSIVFSTDAITNPVQPSATPPYPAAENSVEAVLAQ